MPAFDEWGDEDYSFTNVIFHDIQAISQSVNHEIQNNEIL